MVTETTTKILTIIISFGGTNASASADVKSLALWGQVTCSYLESLAAAREPRWEIVE